MRGALLAILIFGAAPPAWAAKPAPAQESLQATRLARPVQGAAIVVPRDSCGTHWTGWVKEIGADVNPCPKGCERGKRLRLDEHKNSGVTEYQANYECYLPRLEVPQPALKPRAAGAPPRQNCGTMWTGWQSGPKSAANPCPANCERGELRAVNRSLSNGKLAYDMNYQCYVKNREIRKSPREAFKPQVVTTDAILLTGTRRPPFVPVVATTDPIQLTGTRRPPFVPVVVTTDSIELTGTRRPRVAPKFEGEIIYRPGTVQPPTPR